MTTYAGTKEFEGATFVKTSFKGATMRFSDVSGVTMRSVDVDGLDIDSHDLAFGTLIVNGVDVVPLVEAELNRQFPGRELQRSQTPEGLREGWVARAGRVGDDGRRHACATSSTPTSRTSGPWPQTLRHLVLATDAWLRGGISGWSSPSTRSARSSPAPPRWASTCRSSATDAPTFEEILAVRAERQQLVTDFLATATPELLAEERDNPWGGGDWHPTVGDCVRVILEEEWAHLRYVRRDLALLRCESAALPLHRGEVQPHEVVGGAEAEGLVERTDISEGASTTRSMSLSRAWSISAWSIDRAMPCLRCSSAT